MRDVTLKAVRLEFDAGWLGFPVALAWRVPLARLPSSGKLATMELPVFVPDWQIGDGDIGPPFLGMAVSCVLVFYTASADPAMHYGSFGREVTITGEAKHLPGHIWPERDSFPTSLTGEGFVLYWDAPEMTEGPVTVTGIVTVSDYGTAPEGFPAVSGEVTSLELATVLYANRSGDGINWEPMAGSVQQFRPISSYPDPVDEAPSAASPKRMLTGAVFTLDTGISRSLEAQASAVAAERPEGPESQRIRIRVFPDYAGTVLWLHGPVNYSEAALSPALATDMAAWESSYVDSLEDNQAWMSRGDAAEFTSTGNLLAQRLADELGSDFDVEFHSYEARARPMVFHAGRPATNSGAAEAFHAVVAAEQERQGRREADPAGGIAWFAYAPLPGTTFVPGTDFSTGQEEE